MVDPANSKKVAEGGGQEAWGWEWRVCIISIISHHDFKGSRMGLGRSGSRDFLLPLCVPTATHGRLVMSGRFVLPWTSPDPLLRAKPGSRLPLGGPKPWL